MPSAWCQADRPGWIPGCLGWHGHPGDLSPRLQVSSVTLGSRSPVVPATEAMAVPWRPGALASRWRRRLEDSAISTSGPTWNREVQPGRIPSPGTKASRFHGSCYARVQGIKEPGRPGAKVMAAPMSLGSWPTW